jgi:hypothetical protein
MADNVVLDPGAGGATVATDDIGGVHYERVKLTDGTADSATFINSGNGTHTNALRVTIASDTTGVVAVTDNGGTLSVDDGAGSLTVDGSVTADTELPAAAALADAAANPTTPLVGAAALLYNGTTWDRQRGDITNGLDVDVTRLPALPAGGNNIGDVDVLTIAAGTNLIGDVGIKARTTGGFTVGPASGAKQISAASTNGTSVKASAGQVFGWYIYNDGAAEAYFKIYNKASAPTVGTDVPVLVLAIPAGSAANVFTDIGIPFGTGIATAITTGAADADTGAVAANQVVSNLFYA